MFQNVGTKLKVLAYVSSICGIIGSVIGGIILLDSSTVLGILVIIIGALVSWLSSLSLYGIGEAVDQATEAAANTYRGASNSSYPLSVEDRMLLDKLKEKERHEAELKQQAKEEQLRQKWKQELQECGEQNWLSRFFEEALNCNRIADIKVLWDNIPKAENALNTALSNQISESLAVQNAYGHVNGAEQKLVEKLKKIAIEFETIE